MISQSAAATSKIIAFSFALTALTFAGIARSTPYVPTDGTKVVETLKKDAHQRELQVMRKMVADNPGNIYTVSDLTQRYIAEARNTGDPRYLGYAQATLAPWWKQAEAPTQILVLRATLLQSSHQFPAALNDLNLVLRKDRNNPQAWLTRATIQQVTGHYAEAKNSCMHLYSLAPEIITTTCLNNIASLNGEADKSYAALADVYKKSPHIDPSIKIWVLTLLAEMSTRRGDAVAAQSWYKIALGVDTPDSYLLGSYADFLLDQNRAAEVIALLKEKTRVDALLLRYTIALQNQKSSLAQEQVNTLEQRFNAAIMREDTVHQREHARFELQVKNHPAIALALAQKNWAIQKEAADLRIYLEAALASNSRQAALPALEWLKANKLEDKAVQALVEKLGGAV
jgi:Tfp pilus assembly protein PilF